MQDANNHAFTSMSLIQGTQSTEGNFSFSRTNLASQLYQEPSRSQMLCQCFFKRCFSWQAPFLQHNLKYSPQYNLHKQTHFSKQPFARVIGTKMNNKKIPSTVFSAGDLMLPLKCGRSNTLGHNLSWLWTFPLVTALFYFQLLIFYSYITKSFIVKCHVAVSLPIIRSVSLSLPHRKGKENKRALNQYVK